MTEEAKKFELSEAAKEKIKEYGKNMGNLSVDLVFDLIEIFAKESENKVDDMIIPFLGDAKAFVKAKIAG